MFGILVVGGDGYLPQNALRSTVTPPSITVSAFVDNEGRGGNLAGVQTGRVSPIPARQREHSRKEVEDPNRPPRQKRATILQHVPVLSNGSTSKLLLRGCRGQGTRF